MNLHKCIYNCIHVHISVLNRFICGETERMCLLLVVNCLGDIIDF